MTTGSSANPESSTGPTSACCSPSLPPTAWPSTWSSARSPSHSRISWPPHLCRQCRPPPGQCPGNFYRRFLPGIAGTLHLFTAALSGNPKALPWTPDMETAFTAAKTAFIAAVPLAHPLPGSVLALATDASDTHVGAVLQQQVGQHWQPLGFFSKKISKAEVN
jgi:hypothetical protein